MCGTNDPYTDLLSMEHELHDIAASHTGLSDFGDQTYRTGMQALLKAFDTDVKLTKTGRAAARGLVIGSLSARLYAQVGWNRHPEALTDAISRPVFIIGLPRSGSTALHRLLATDPQFQWLSLWLSQAPMVRPPRKDWLNYPAYRECTDQITKLGEQAPGHRKIHELTAEDAEECLWVLMQSFFCHGLPWIFGLNSYIGSLTPSHLTHGYRRYDHVLRLMGAGEPHKRWLLKCPSHTRVIDSLLEVFPDACFIHTHRDPVEAIPSLCSLLYSGRRRTEENLRRDSLGPKQCTYWADALKLAHFYRHKFPEKFFDVEYRQFIQDPMKIISSVYKHLDLSLSPESERKMRDSISSHPKAKYGQHQYEVDAWGVSQAEIRLAFGEYRTRYRGRVRFFVFGAG